MISFAVRIVIRSISEDCSWVINMLGVTSHDMTQRDGVSWVMAMSRMSRDASPNMTETPVRSLMSSFAANNKVLSISSADILSRKHSNCHTKLSHWCTGIPGIEKLQSHTCLMRDIHHFINWHILNRHSNPTSTPLLLLFSSFPGIDKKCRVTIVYGRVCVCLFISKVQIPFYYGKSNLFAWAGCIKWLHCILLPRHKCPQMQNIFILENVAPIVKHHWIWNRKYDMDEDLKGCLMK